MTDSTLLTQEPTRVERVAPIDLRSRLLTLKSQGFVMLLDIGGVDYPERSERYEVVYHLLRLAAMPADVAAIGKPERVRILCAVGDPTPTLPTMTDIWPNANWAEREIFDLFGVHFANHPDMRRIQMPLDWEGHPLRKDYPLRGPAREAAPRPSFANKSNVDATTPVVGRTAEVLRARRAEAQKEQS